MDQYIYKSNRHAGRYIIIGQREDGSFCLTKATHITDDENRFSTIEQIEEYLDDKLTMVQHPSTKKE